MGEDSTRSGTVARAIRILQVFAEADGDLSIKELSAITGLAPSTSHRLLHLLAEDDIITLDADHKRYRIGPEFLRIASLVAGRTGLAEIAQPFMERVAETANETCVIVRYLRARGQITVVGACNSANPLQYRTELFSTRSPLWGATGQSVVAFLPRAEQEALYDSRESDSFPQTGARLPSKDVYLHQMEVFAAQGYALSRGQTIEGAVGIGAPVFDKSGDTIGALCVTVPEIRFSQETEDRILGVLLPQAQALSKALGHLGTR
ncbi:IclR family transcriptional regulator [Salipiger abyssi]|uniref:Transcriptional regulator n=1 Tax=Salipiger abyssi TaxID=1250539 RepID=A0A1P8UN49_9RHOB|nr:IclR family transcriptional regulator [Salipiger abyssi]APZ50802.1 transcriptional regulator [Salipiger abyssi]